MGAKVKIHKRLTFTVDVLVEREPKGISARMMRGGVHAFLGIIEGNAVRFAERWKNSLSAATTTIHSEIVDVTKGNKQGGI